MSRDTHLHLMHRGPLTMQATNKSGGTLIAGDVVIVDTTNDSAITSTTSAASTKQVGIVAESIANNATGAVSVAGFVPLVNVTASVTRGNYALTSTTVKKASGTGSRTTGAFAVFLTGGTTPAAWLFGVPDGSSGGGGGSVTVERISGSPSTGNIATIRVANYLVNGAGDVTLYPEITGVGLAGTLIFTLSDTTLYAPDGNSYIDLINGGSVNFNTSGASAGALDEATYIFQVGPNNVPMYIGEKDANTIQMFGSNTFTSDVELTDQASSHWRSAGRDTFNLNAVNRGLAGIVAAAAIANTETVVASYSMPAGMMQPGTTFRIKAFGRLSAGLTAGSSVFRCRIGTTTLTGNIATSLTIANLASATNAPFELDALVTVRTDGATGSVIGNISARGGIVGAFTVAGDVSALSATVAVDTTATKLIELTYISGNAGTTATFENATIEIANG